MHEYFAKQGLKAVVSSRFSFETHGSLQISVDFPPDFLNLSPKVLATPSPQPSGRSDEGPQHLGWRFMGRNNQHKMGNSSSTWGVDHRVNFAQLIYMSI